MTVLYADCPHQPCPVKFGAESAVMMEAALRRHAEVSHKDAPPSPRPVTGYKQTSFDAWIASLPTLNATQRVILDLYRSRGPMTDEAMYEAYGALDPAAYRNTVLPARNALYKIGALIDTGKRAKVRSGRTAIVWGLPAQ